MKTSEKTDQLFPALLEAQKKMGKVGKGGENKFDKYSYAKLEDYYKVAVDVLHDQGLFITESATFYDTNWPDKGDRLTSSGKTEYAVPVHLTLAIIHAPSSQWIEVTAPGHGQDRGDKGVYKALTGARKYAVAMALNLVTTDDPEQDGGNDKVGKPKASDAVNTEPPYGGLSF